MKTSSALGLILIGLFSILARPAHAQQGVLNIICGVQVEWCNSVQDAFSRENRESASI